MTSRSSAPKDTAFDMDALFDFNAGTSQQSPITAPGMNHDSLSTFVQEEQQQFSAPSHNYGQFKQQVGIQLSNMNQANVPDGMFDGYNSGFGDMDFNAGYGYNTGFDLDTDMGVTFPPVNPVVPGFFPTGADATLDFVTAEPLANQDDSQNNVGRLWPGMHLQQAQQAAMAKAAQAQALQQQRQHRLSAQLPTAPLRQASNNPLPQPSQASSTQPSQSTGNKRASNNVEPHVEESISRLLNQMRQNGGTLTPEDGESGLLPHIARMKKDEEEMDEDERLLASEEGKKLSSKERRQLRNKVSARAFRSRRKEYITQLEGEIAMRSQEINALRVENQSVMQENERYRGLIETLLRHPAFTPFINDISKDPSLLGVPQEHVQQHQQQQQQQRRQQQQQQQQILASNAPLPSQRQQQTPSSSSSNNLIPHQPQPQQPDMKLDFLDFDASQLQIPTPQPEEQQQHINLATIPENDFSKLDINSLLFPQHHRSRADSGFHRSARDTGSSSSSVGAYAVTDLPIGPRDLFIESSRKNGARESDSQQQQQQSYVDYTLLFAELSAAAGRLGMRC